jgi:4-amino-4-deoxychorismate lyase
VENALRGPHTAGLRLIETFRREPVEGFVRLEAHLARMAAGAAALGFPFDRAAIDRALAGVPEGDLLRVRLTLDADGAADAATAPLGPALPSWTVALARERLRSDDPWLRVKTTRRPAYDAARASLGQGIDEAILLNERGEVCEGTITSVFLDLGDGLMTPPLACGLLPGVLRAALLADGTAREAVLRPADLGRGRLFIGNSLRGLIPARLAEAPPKMPAGSMDQRSQLR